MGKTRLEAFSDGVIAIIITIMVLELKVPHGVELASLLPLIPTLSSYALSFVYVGIYWNNHHHLLHACSQVNGGMLWANLHLLFWLSLVPFTTGWMGENHFASAPVALYGFNLLMAALAYSVLQRLVVGTQGADSPIARALARDWKGKASPVLYCAGMVIAFWSEWVTMALYVAGSIMWLVPDRRIERALVHGSD